VKTAILIPAWNEAATIARVVREVAAFGTPLVVDDGSSDDTGQLARAAGAIVVRHARNTGYDGALQSGFVEADRRGMEAVVTFDADGQHTAETLGRVVQLLEGEGRDLVLGLRAEPARFAERLFSLYTRWRFGIGDILCGLKGYRMTLFKRHGRFDGTRSIGTELALFALRSNASYAVVQVPIRPRESGKTRFGSVIRGNARILRAMLLAVVADFRGRFTAPDSAHPAHGSGEKVR